MKANKKPVIHSRMNIMLVGVTPRLLKEISVILSEAFIGQPTSCRHLFLSALPDVIIIRDPEWTFVAHGLVFR